MHLQTFYQKCIHALRIKILLNTKNCYLRMRQNCPVKQGGHWQVYWRHLFTLEVQTAPFEHWLFSQLSTPVSIDNNPRVMRNDQMDIRTQFKTVIAGMLNIGLGWTVYTLMGSMSTILPQLGDTFILIETLFFQMGIPIWAPIRKHFCLSYLYTYIRTVNLIIIIIIIIHNSDIAHNIEVSMCFLR